MDDAQYRFAAGTVILVRRIREGQDLESEIDADRMERLIEKLIRFRDGPLASWLQDGGFDGADHDLQTVRDSVEFLIRKLYGRKLAGMSTAELVKILRQD